MNEIKIPNKLYKQLESIKIYRELVNQKKMNFGQIIKEMIDVTRDTLW